MPDVPLDVRGHLKMLLSLRTLQSASSTSASTKQFLTPQLSPKGMRSSTEAMFPCAFPLLRALVVLHPHCSLMWWVVLCSSITGVAAGAGCPLLAHSFHRALAPLAGFAMRLPSSCLRDVSARTLHQGLCNWPLKNDLGERGLAARPCSNALQWGRRSALLVGLVGSFSSILAFPP